MIQKSKSSAGFPNPKSTRFLAYSIRKTTKNRVFLELPECLKQNTARINRINALNKFYIFFKIPIDRDLSISGHSTLDSKNFDIDPV